MARPTKYEPERAEKIIERLRVGCTRKDACLSAGIHEGTLANWLRRFSDFSDLVAYAEAECAARMTAVISKAAGGYEKTETHTTRKTVFREKVTKYEDGSVTRESVPFVIEDVETVLMREFDWRAALEWLKRRRRVDWGDSIDIRKLDDETLLRLIAVAEGGDEAGHTGS